MSCLTKLAHICKVLPRTTFSEKPIIIMLRKKDGFVTLSRGTYSLIALDAIYGLWAWSRTIL
ncbi:hypothetical protein [Fretibacter rubidus]|uniref:hypothetical protein n=1 Tax=Fretibacter rubidus TaxID=570162 RepID=UPI00352BA27A